MITFSIGVIVGMFVGHVLMNQNRRSKFFESIKNKENTTNEKTN